MLKSDIKKIEELKDMYNERVKSFIKYMSEFNDPDVSFHIRKDELYLHIKGSGSASNIVYIKHYETRFADAIINFYGNQWRILNHWDDILNIHRSKN